MLDDGVVNAAKLLNALITSDAATLESFGIKNADKVTVKEKLDAIKQVLGASAGEMKALSTEKKTEDKPVQTEAKKPTFTTVAKISQKSA